MPYLNNMKPLADFRGGKFIGLYGRGSSGKTTASASFPNPVFIIFDDQGLASIKAEYPERPYIDASGLSAEELGKLVDEIAASRSVTGQGDETFVFSTFSVWIENNVKTVMTRYKKPTMTMDMWGAHNTEVKDVIRKMATAARNNKRIIVEFHEKTSTTEGYANELVPEIHVNAGASVQAYLTGMLNYAFHTAVKTWVNPDNPMDTRAYYAIDIDPANPYYWIKGQGRADNIPKDIAVRKGQTYEKLKEWYPNI